MEQVGTIQTLPTREHRWALIAWVALRLVRELEQMSAKESLSPQGWLQTMREMERVVRLVPAIMRQGSRMLSG